MGRPALDLTGKRFGRLLALYRTSAYKEHPVKWQFLCDCGNTKELTGSIVSKNRIDHCGCETANNRSAARRDNIEGNTYYNLTVLSYHGSKYSHSLWDALCVCGNIIVVDGSDLKQGDIRSCPNCRSSLRAEARIIDELGNVYNQLTVIDRANRKNNKGERYWICKCTCGTVVEVRGSHLRSGAIQRCRACWGRMQRVENPISGYPAEFSLGLRTKIRKRDLYICQYCKVQYGIGELDIHHIDHDRNYNDPINLVSLCNTCHYKMHRKDADDWVPYWQQYMEERYRA